MQRKRIIDLIVLFASIALIVALGAVRALQHNAASSEPSTYDTGFAGYAALYELLQREGVRAGRFERPLGELPPGGMLVVAGDGVLAPFAAARTPMRQLDLWVRAGGKLVLLDGSVPPAVRESLGIPASHPIVKTDSASADCAFGASLRERPVAGAFTRAYARVCRRDSASVLHSGSSAVALTYRRGKGSVAVFSTPTVFDNLHI